MKPKQLNKKLALNKQSISNIGNPEMRNVRGGFDPLPPTTYTCMLCDSNISCPGEPYVCMEYEPGTPTHTCQTVNPNDTCVSNAYTYCNCM